MNSSSFISYAPVALVAVAFVMYYTNGTQAVINPTAQQALTNRSFMLFLVYITAILALALVSLQTKSMSVFFSLLALLSFAWFILGKSWQYVPS
jgi:hypothetical protein